MESVKVSYDGNTDESYDLYLNGDSQIEILLGEDAVIEIVAEVQNIIGDAQIEDIEITPIKGGFNVNVFKDTKVVGFITVWFDDYIL